MWARAVLREGNTDGGSHTILLGCIGLIKEEQNGHENLQRT